MKMIRRGVLAAALAGIVAAAVRLRGSTGPPAPESGGWRELSGPDLK